MKRPTKKPSPTKNNMIPGSTEGIPISWPQSPDQTDICQCLPDFSPGLVVQTSALTCVESIRYMT